jgi:hypothetical protein
MKLRLTHFDSNVRKLEKRIRRNEIETNPF